MSPGLQREVEDHDLVVVVAARRSADDVQPAVEGDVDEAEVVVWSQKLRKRGPGLGRL